MKKLARVLFSVGISFSLTTGVGCSMLKTSSSSGVGASYGDSSSSLGGGGDSAGVGGSSGGAEAVAEGEDYPKPAKPGKMDPNAPKPVQELWAKWVAIHQTATASNLAETGKKLWPLMNGEAHSAAATSIGSVLRAVGMDKVGLKLETLTYTMIGSIAAWRANRVVGADMEVRMRERDDGSVTAEFTGRYMGDLIPDFEAREEDGAWVMVPAGGLFASGGRSIREVPEDKRPKSLDALGKAWGNALDKGTGGELYDLTSTATHNTINSTASREGISLTTVIAVLDAALIARRELKNPVTGSSVDGTKVVLTFADGTSTTYQADKFGDDYFIDLSGY
jgi:hypothetical protein